MRAATYMMGAERKVQRTSEAAIYVGGGKEHIPVVSRIMQLPTLNSLLEQVLTTGEAQYQLQL